VTLTKIISGGQTGVDRGALDAALERGFSCGGYCPEGRLAEDGPIADIYPLTELEQGGYAERTIRNVVESDGTLVIYFGSLEGGTEQTVRHCIERGKPCKLVDANEVTILRATKLIEEFVIAYSICVLNVAGPRLSKAPLAHSFAFAVIEAVLRRLGSL